jgi:hypothetical protein
MRQSGRDRKRNHKKGLFSADARPVLAKQLSSLRYFIRIETDATVARCRDMPGWNARQLVSLWPVLLGSVAVGLLIAFVSGS